VEQDEIDWLPSSPWHAVERKPRRQEELTRKRQVLFFSGAAKVYMSGARHRRGGLPVLGVPTTTDGSDHAVDSQVSPGLLMVLSDLVIVSYLMYIN
jgi:hypothetical protein